MKDEFGLPDYDGMYADLKKYFADKGKDLDDVLKKAAIHFNKPLEEVIRKKRLTNEEIEQLIKEETEFKESNT
jgi:hypothetical protein